MSASPRPMTASPRSRLNVREGSPRSSRMEIDGVLMRPPMMADVGFTIETRSPTRVPQLAQNRSLPLTYLAPQLRQAPSTTLSVVLVPQEPQKEFPAGTISWHLRHFVAEPTSMGAVVAETLAAPPPTEALNGLPQSAQKPAFESFSVPQKEQATFTEGVDAGGWGGDGGGVTAWDPAGGRKTAWAANIGRVKGGVNETNDYKVVLRSPGHPERSEGSALPYETR